MSLQSNLKAVKEEFKSDEKILENAFRAEILWRRYRKYVIVLLLCGIGFGVYLGIESYLRTQKAQAASSAYAKLVENATDEKALLELKNSSKELYELYRYFNASGDKAVYEELANSQNKLIANLAQYELASLNASASMTESSLSESSIQEALSLGLDSVKQANLRDFALLQEAFLLFKADKIKEAHQKLLLIPETSPLSGEAKLLRHYGN